MKKLITSGFVITSMLLSPTLKADEALDDYDNTQTTEMYQEEDDNEEETVVGQGSDEGAKAAKNKQWQNIALAAGAVAVAVTALILVASNNGHK